MYLTNQTSENVMRVLIVSNGYPPTAYGGVEVYSQEIARGLLDRGHEVLVFCRESDAARPDVSITRERREGVAVVRLVNDFKRPRSFASSYTDARVEAVFGEVVEAFCPDVVHFNHFIALSSGLPAVTASSQIPSVLTLHDFWPICHRVNLFTGVGTVCQGPRAPADCFACVFMLPGSAGWRYRLGRLLKPVLPIDWRVRLNRRLGQAGDFSLLTRASTAHFAERARQFAAAFQQVNRVLVPSQFVRDTYAANSFPMQDAQVLPLGINLRPLPRRPAPAGMLRLGFIGPLLPIKGIDRLVRSFRVSPDAKVSLQIYGRDDLQPLFTRHVRSLAAGDSRIVFHGPFRPEQRAEIYADLDLLVIPSLAHETFSLAAREALQAGVPVIAPRVGALPEVIRDGVNGFLYPPESEEALAMLIARLAHQPDLLDGLSLPGPVDILDAGAHLARLEQVYEDVLANAVLSNRVDGKIGGCRQMETSSS